MTLQDPQQRQGRIAPVREVFTWSSAVNDPVDIVSLVRKSIRVKLLQNSSELARHLPFTVGRGDSVFRAGQFGCGGNTNWAPSSQPESASYRGDLLMVTACGTCRELPEAVAIRLAQRGDSSAFEQLYRLHVRRIFALCLRMLGNAAEAEDLTQEIFLAAFRKLKSFRGDSAFSTWLHRVGVNAVLMHLRKKRLLSTSLEEIAERREANDQPAFEPGGIDARLEGHADRVRLEKAIEQLPAGYKLSLILHDVQGYLHTEIAEILGCTTGTTKSQLHKARLRVREILRKDELAAGRGTRGSAADRGIEALAAACA